jgi:predicted ATPase/class 3 adenylate cyclase
MAAACRRCGSVLGVDARFCSACGTPVEERGGEERKVVTVLFADLVGSTAYGDVRDPEDVRAVLRPYFSRLREEIDRFGGVVEKYIGDAVMALFGVPAAHEDDPERAVRAALAVRDTIAQVGAAGSLELQVRLAIHTGEAVVALDAHPDAGEKAAYGDLLNTAYRIQEAAPPNGVLVGESTWRATRDVFEFGDAYEIAAKGKSQPLTVRTVLQARSEPHQRFDRTDIAPLVGRSDELELLAGALKRAQRERMPQLVTLMGPPGIGKSRLVWELATNVAAEDESVRWLRGRCLPYGDGVTFWALGEIVKSRAGILESDTAAEAEAKLGQAVRRAFSDEAEAEWIARHLRPLVGLADESALAVEGRDEAFAAWRRAVEALAQNAPVVLAFEDLHWADDGLLDFIDHLVDWAQGIPLLVLGTTRPELLDRRRNWGGGKRNATTMSLGPLSAEDTDELVSGQLEGSGLPQDVHDTVLAAAQGNPLYAEEYLRMLVDRGILERTGGTWRLSVSELPVPETVQAIIAARLDALPAPEKSLLQDAAVLGHGFWMSALEAMTGESRWAIDERLRSLTRKDLVRSQRSSAVVGESEYAFHHVLVRDVAYAQIPRATRASKHAAAAAWLEGVGRSEDNSEMLAHHYLLALEYARAAGEDTSFLADSARSALIEAGDRAAALAAFEAAERFYEAARELTGERDPELPQLLLRLGRARIHARGTGSDVLPEAAEGLLALGDREGAAEAFVLLGRSAIQERKPDRASEYLHRAAELLGDSPATPVKAALAVHLAALHMVVENAEAAIAAASDALAQAERLGLDELRANALTTIGTARAAGGDLAGLDDLRQGIEIAAALNSNEVLRGYLHLGSVLANHGDLRDAADAYAEGRAAAERFGDRVWLGRFDIERLYQRYWSGDWSAALADAEATLAADGHPGAPDARLVRGWILLGRSDHARAVADAEAAVADARATHAPGPLLAPLAFLARALAAAGRDAEANATVDELLELWRSTPAPPSFWTTDLAAALELTGRGEELDAPARRPRTAWLEAADALARGEHTRAAELYAEIGSAPDEEYARLRLGSATARTS